METWPEEAKGILSSEISFEANYPKLIPIYKLVERLTWKKDLFSKTGENISDVDMTYTPWPWMAIISHVQYFLVLLLVTAMSAKANRILYV